ncbi:MAG TPA: T9SS type A sorting domain-containing protein [Bacteroidia bacterium]|jgi:hypothetical protein
MRSKHIFPSGFLIWALAATANAQTLDQSVLNYNSGISARNLPGYSIFQSFTAGLSGTLTAIEWGVFNNMNGNGTLIIYSGPDTTGTVLQNLPVNVVCPSGNCMVSFTTSVPVTASQVYTFRFIPGSGIPDPYGVQAGCPGSYAGGEGWLIDPSGIYDLSCDLVFQTYVNTSVGTADPVSQIHTINFYPNPASDQTTLHFDVPVKDADLLLIDMLGQTVFEKHGVTGSSFSFSKNDLQNGMYFARIIQDEQVIATAKLSFVD